MENIEIKIEKRKINWLRVFEYSAPAIITILISVFALIVNKCFPFGENQVGYIDYNEGLVPAYTGLWNFFHGKSNLLVDWNLGAGGSVISSWILNSFLSPISWLIALFPKEGILHGISLLIIIRFALMATTAYWCFKKLFPNVNKIILYLFAISWTFSGWTLVHFTNIGWLDLMILLPVLLICAKDLVENGKTLWFIVVLSYLLMLSYYITYMILVGTVGICTIYIILFAKEKKKVAAKLFYSIIISILISAVAFIPSCLTSLQGHRFSGVKEVNPSELYENFLPKFVTITMFAFPVTFFIRLLFNYKQDKKNILFFILSFAYLIVGLFIEPINKMWHTGSYFSFPYRYSFLIVLLMIIGSLYYIDKHLKQKSEILEKEHLINKQQLLQLISTTLFIVLLILNALTGSGVHPYQASPLLHNLLYILMFAAGYFCIEVWLKNKNKKLMLGKMPGAIIIFILCISQTLVFTGKFMSEKPISSGIVTNTFEINLENLDSNYKLKDKDSNYNLNMAYQTCFPTMQTWIHISSEEQWQAHAKLGYNYFSTQLFSSGGTLLTDYLVGNKYVLSQTELNSNYYKLLDTFDYETIHNIGDDNYIQEMKLYESLLDISPIYTTNVNLSTLLENFEYTDTIEIQNTLFKELFNSNQNIMNEITFTYNKSDEGYTIEADVPTNQTVYLVSHKDIIYLEIDSWQKTAYSGLAELGTYSSGKIKIDIKEKYNDHISLSDLANSIKLTAFNTELFINSYSTKQQNQSKIEFNGASINVKVNNTNGDKYAFIPFGNLKNMSATNNGKEVEVLSAFDGFMMVELNEGENNITLTYTPQNFKVCLMVTLISIALLVIILLLNKKFHLDNKKIFIWPGFIGAVVILTAVTFLVFAKPFLNFFVILFS